MASSPHVSYDTAPEEISLAVIGAVSNAENTDPENLNQSLYDAIDPDALNNLFAGEENNPTKCTFQYHGYTVTIEGDSKITLDPIDKS